MPENPREILKRYKTMGAHLLNEPTDFSSVENGPFKFVFTELELNTQGPYPNGHIYRGTKGNQNSPDRYRLAGGALEALARCVNLNWSTTETRLIHVGDDNIIAQAMGGLRLPDGSMAVSSPQKYEFSLIAKRENLRLQRLRSRSQDYRTKNLNDVQFASWLENYLLEEVAKERNFMITKAETGAKNRVIRKMLPLKGEYTLEELKKPFVGVQVVLQPDYSDPDLRRQLNTVFLTSVAGSFGLPVPVAPASPSLATPMNHVTGHVVDTSPPRQPIPPEAGLSTDDEISIRLSQYREQGNREQRLSWINALVGETGYDMGKLKKPITDYEDGPLEQFFIKLLRSKLTGGQNHE